MSLHRSRTQTRSSARTRRCRSFSSPPPRCITKKKRQISFSKTTPLSFERGTTAILEGDDWCLGGSEENEPYVPSEDLGEGLDVAVDHLLLGGALPAGLVHHDEPVLVVAPREQRRHLRGRAVPARAGPRRAVAVPARPPRHPAREAEARGRRDDRRAQQQRLLCGSAASEERGEGGRGGVAGEEPPRGGCGGGGGHGGKTLAGGDSGRGNGNGCGSGVCVGIRI